MERTGPSQITRSDPKRVQVDFSSWQEIEQQLVPVLSAAPADVVAAIHLAADSRVSAPWESVLQNNIIATRNFYELMRSSDIKRVIFASSNHVTAAYENDPLGRPIRAADPPRPLSD